MSVFFLSWLSDFMEVDQFPMNRLKRSLWDANEDEDMHTANSRMKRDTPYLIFPEILCIIDYDGYRWKWFYHIILRSWQSEWIYANYEGWPWFWRLHGKDNIAIKRYVISFWNGIDLRYKLLKGPAVKISIAGIIISRVSWIASDFYILSS